MIENFFSRPVMHLVMRTQINWKTISDTSFTIITIEYVHAMKENIQ
jgi:hypothetical protein